jgi:Fic family protein
LGTLAPERLAALRRVATIESIGSSTRIEGSKLSDREVEQLLANLEIKSFATRDEQEVAGYAETMELVLQSWQEIALTENHVKQLHRDLLRYSEKDSHHRGQYKTQPNSVSCFFEFIATLRRFLQKFRQGIHGITAIRRSVDTLPRRP